MPNHYIMRKYFLILALALICTGAAAQKVTLNERDEHGDRNIETGFRGFYVDGHLHMCQLCYVEHEDNEFYILSFAFSDQASSWKALEGQELMMKDEQDNVLTIQSFGVSTSTLSRDTKNRGGVSYLCSTRYYLTKEQAEIIRNGLIKLRVNITYDNTDVKSMFDVEIPADLTAYLKKAIKNIDKTIPMPVSVDKSVF